MKPEKWADYFSDSISLTEILTQHFQITHQLLKQFSKSKIFSQIVKDQQEEKGKVVFSSFNFIKFDSENSSLSCFFVSVWDSRIAREREREWEVKMMEEDLGVEAKETAVREVVKLLPLPELLQSISSIKADYIARQQVLGLYVVLIWLMTEVEGISFIVAPFSQFIA